MDKITENKIRKLVRAQINENKLIVEYYGGGGPLTPGAVKKILGDPLKTFFKEVGLNLQDVASAGKFAIKNLYTLRPSSLKKIRDQRKSEKEKIKGDLKGIKDSRPLGTDAKLFMWVMAPGAQLTKAAAKGGFKTTKAVYNWWNEEDAATSKDDKKGGSGIASVAKNVAAVAGIYFLGKMAYNKYKSSKQKNESIDSSTNLLLEQNVSEEDVETLLKTSGFYAEAERIVQDLKDMKEAQLKDLDEELTLHFDLFEDLSKVKNVSEAEKVLNAAKSEGIEVAAEALPAIKGLIDKDVKSIMSDPEKKKEYLDAIPDGASSKSGEMDDKKLEEMIANTIFVNAMPGLLEQMEAGAQALLGQAMTLALEDLPDQSEWETVKRDGLPDAKKLITMVEDFINKLGPNVRPTEIE